MAEHLTDEEQLENLKNWWRENGLRTLLTLALIGGGWFGWQHWQEYRAERAASASLLYQEMMETAESAASGDYSDEQRGTMTHLAVTLKDEYAGTQYARYGALLLAKLAVAENDLETAVEELQWVLDSGPDRGMELIARLRLARVEAARENYDRAMALLEAPDGDNSFAASYAEVRGDIHLRRGDHPAARAAYQAALDSLPPDQSRSRPLLQLKLNQIMPADETGDSEPEENNS